MSKWFEVVWFDANGVEQVDRFQDFGAACRMQAALRYYFIRAEVR